MRDPNQPFSARSMVAVGILVGAAVVRVALADSEDLAAKSVAPSPPPQAMATSASTHEAVAAPTSKAAAVAAPMSGVQVYNNVCIACHGAPGVGGAPALGDGDAWAARVARGKDSLIDHALHGFSGSTGIMPMKGGRIDLSDDEIIGAVEYMIEQVDQ